MIDKNKQNQIIQKARMKIAISNFEKENIETETKKNNLLKIVASFILVTGITGGLAYATGNAIEKIWKEPESYQINNTLTQSEKEQCISENEAENIGNSYLKQIGFTDDNIQSLNLEKEFLSDENVWKMGSKKATLTIDGKTGKIKSVQIPTWEYKIPNNYGIDRVEARKVAKELFEKYKINDSGEYKLVKLTRNMETDKDSYIWYANFYRKYGDLLNPYENVEIGFIPTINGLYSLSLQNNIYENNEEKISKDEAINIATEKDKQIEKSKTIKETSAKVQIEQMNEEVYLRENFKDEYERGTLNMEKIGENSYKLKNNATFYKVDNRVRKAWVVVINYDVEGSSSLNQYSYFVDCTTGEIIGGQKGNASIKIDNLISDPYNLIEK